MSSSSSEDILNGRMLRNHNFIIKLNKVNILNKFKFLGNDYVYLEMNKISIRHAKNILYSQLSIKASKGVY
jgi:hypothetical protein